MSKDYGSKQKTQVKNYSAALILTVLAFVAANVGATQYTAAAFNYHPNLGDPIIGKFYNPFGWITWQFEYFDIYSYFFKTLNITMVGIFTGVFVLYIIVRLLGLRKAKIHDDIHGTAHWMEEKEVKETGLMDATDGAYIGAYKNKKGDIKYLRHNGPEHIMAFAPTRSGKGVGLVLPTLLAWRESALILDIKGENYALTSGWRSQHANNICIKFDPTAKEGDTIKYNPLEEIRVGTEYETADLQNITMMIVDPEGKGLADYWQKSAFSFLNGLILYAIELSEKGEIEYPSLATIYEILNGDEIQTLLEKMTKSPHKIIKLVAREALNKAEQELSGVIGSAGSYLNLYVDPVVARNTAASEFKIQDLMNNEKPVSLYLVIKPSDKDRLMPLVRLVINQILRKLVEEIKFQDGQSVATYKHRLLLMLDEFTSLGKLEVFQESLAYMAGYGLKAYIIIQDTTQLYNAYTKDESIMSNCHVKIAYAPNKMETAELLSKMAGTTTVTKSFTTTSGNRISVLLGQVSESMQEVSRPLLTPDECMRLPGAKKDSQGKVTEPGDMLIFIAGQAPIYGKQILYFKDDVFMARAKVPSLTKQTPLLDPKVSKTIREDRGAKIE
ncbi:MAG: type IV secretory system conjugative DNA transfer family protein [Campylobacterales bacterium]|nr:type IV secretory system conjugative DNA transfer family protein [Campylobacterales bacterium]